MNSPIEARARGLSSIRRAALSTCSVVTSFSSAACCKSHSSGWCPRGRTRAGSRSHTLRAARPDRTQSASRSWATAASPQSQFAARLESPLLPLRRRERALRSDQSPPRPKDAETRAAQTLQQRTDGKLRQPPLKARKESARSCPRLETHSSPPSQRQRSMLHQQRRCRLPVELVAETVDEILGGEMVSRTGKLPDQISHRVVVLRVRQPPNAKSMLGSDRRPVVGSCRRKLLRRESCQMLHPAQQQRFSSEPCAMRSPPGCCPRAVGIK